MIEYIVKFNGGVGFERKTTPNYDLYPWFAGGGSDYYEGAPLLVSCKERAVRYATPEAAFAAALPYLGMGGGYVVLPVETPDPLPEPIEIGTARIDGRHQLSDVDWEILPNAMPGQYRIRIEFLERLS